MGKEYLRDFRKVADISGFRGVIYRDAFQDLQGWSASGTGTDWLVAYHKRDYVFGKACLRAVTRETTPAIGDTVTILQQIPFSFTKAFRFDLFFVRDLDGISHDFFFRPLIRDGTTEHYAYVKYDGGTDTWQYTTDGTNYSDISGGNVVHAPDVWTSLSLIVDIENGNYTSLMANNTEIDMSDISLYQTTNGDNPRISLVVEWRNDTGDVVEGRLNLIIVDWL